MSYDMRCPFIFNMTGKNNIELKKRLSAAAYFIRKDSFLADIGTDHAFLPIYCVENNVCRRAVAADINKMPLERAADNIRAHGLEDRIECVLTSGFSGLDGYGITDGAVCGMGGELIASIIKNDAFIKSDGFRLILQPMTMLDEARKALCETGFEISGEITLCEDGKFYTVICSDHTGNVSQMSKFELLFGNFEKKMFESDEVKRAYIEHQILKYERIVNGKKTAGMDFFDEIEKIEFLKERL